MAAGAVPPSVAKIFEIESEGDTIFLTPLINLDELAFQQIEDGAAQIFALLDQSLAKNVIVDFRRTDYYGSTALGFFVKLWKRVRSRDGGMAFCQVSPHEKEILEITKLDHLWPLCASREDALAALRH